MSTRLYSVEQVADLLGLHVKTVRGYVRDGRLNAVRIGKQYRIAEEDVAAFTGRPVEPPARETARRRRHVEVSSIVQIDAISPAETIRLSNTLVAAAVGRGQQPGELGPLRVQTVYDEESASLKVIIFGGPEATAELLIVVRTLLEETP